MSSPALDAAAVAAYLEQHPDFLARHPELLLRLSLPHVQAGLSPQAGASSLLERQIKLQRDKHRDLQGQIIELLQIAAGNEQLFVQCRELILTLLAGVSLPAERLPGLLAELEQGLRRGFGLEAAAVLCAAGRYTPPGRRSLDRAEAARMLGPELWRAPWCGTPTQPERDFLFGPAGAELKSAATVPLGPGGELGLLALASRDPERFRAGMGTLFLDFVGAALTAVLARIQP